MKTYIIFIICLILILFNIYYFINNYYILFIYLLLYFINHFYLYNF